MPLVKDEKRYIPGEEKYWLAFSRVSGIGTARMRRLFDYFGGMALAWKAGAGDLLAAGLEPKLTERLLTFRASFDLEAALEKLDRLGISLLTLDGPGYPERLAQLDLPPAVLYIKGNLEEADQLALAIVGTRRATAYGKQATKEICAELAERGVTIISGLARGIDTVAHQAALEAGGRTLAVLGSGLDVIYPYENKALAAKICEPGAGALISTFAPGSQPDAVNFPARNLIVSGLAMGVFVVESDNDGGAMITATAAVEQGRDVYALPGSVYNRFSNGTHKLIRQGAKLVTSAAEILEELQPGRLIDAREARAELAHMGDNEIERVILRILRQAGGPLHIDDICHECGLPMTELNSVLVMMELKGMVQNMGGMRYGVTRF